MYNLLIALGVGLVVVLALFLPGILGLGEAIVPGVLAITVAYFVLVRRTFKQAEGIFQEGARALQSMPPKFDLAIATFESVYALAPWQFGLRSQVDAQIGVTYFLQQNITKALPYLARAHRFSYWLSAAMLAVIYYKKKDLEAMRGTLKTVVKRGKKHSLAWNLSAYLLCQIGDRDAAQQLLVDGLKKTNGDVKVKEALLALQNGKKIKMRSYNEQWYQFHLERPPAKYQQAPVGQRVGKAARRGRW